MKLLILAVYLSSVLICAFTLRMQAPSLARWLPERSEIAFRFALAGLGAVATAFIALGWPMFEDSWTVAAAAGCLVAATGLSVLAWFGVPFFARERPDVVARRIATVSFGTTLVIVAIAYVVNPGAWVA